nr:hypothetical protein [Tanacetum cinerariifolium]
MDLAPRSFVLPPPVMIVSVAATVITGPDITGPSQPVGTELSADTFYVSQDMDSETLPCPSLALFLTSCAEVRMQTEHILRERKRFEGRCASELDSLRERNQALECANSTIEGQVAMLNLWPEQYEAVQDEQVKILSDRVAELDYDLMEYVAALGAAIGLAIDKCMQIGLVAGIDHEKAGRGLAEVATYDPFMQERYVASVLALRNLEFNFLSWLES